MIVLYGGRLVVQRKLLSENWRATIKVPTKTKLTVDLGTPDVRQAFIRAQHHYLALKTDRDVVDVETEALTVLKCWSCLNWLPRTNECSFGFPEARQTGGRYASRCEMYNDGIQNNQED